MKKTSYFLGIVAALCLGFSSCKEGTDFDIEMVTPLHPVGGQYFGYVYGIEDNSNQSDADFWKAVASSVSYDAANEAVMYNGQEIEYVTYNYCYLSNTTDYATDKCWVRFGSTTASNYFNINCKLDFNKADFTFKGTNVGNYRGNSATPRDGENIVISGIAQHNTYKTPTGGIDDEMIFIYSLENKPGMRYIVWGFKNTLWDEDRGEGFDSSAELVRAIKAYASKL